MRAALLAILLLVPGIASAQAEADTTAIPTSGGLADIGQRAADSADSNASSLADSLANGLMVEPSFLLWRWLQEPAPTFRGSVVTDVNRVQFSGGGDFFARLGVDGNFDARYERSHTEFRQQDRISDTSNFGAGLKNAPSWLDKLELRFDHNQLEDVTRFSGNEITVENVTNRASLALGDQRELGFLQQTLQMKAGVNDVQSKNRGTQNDRQLANGALSGRWRYEKEWGEILTRLGYDRATGDRQLAQVTDDATTTLDTVGTTIKYLREGLTVEATLDKSRFEERRLDFRRNSTGIVDTIFSADDSLANDLDKILNETETQGERKASLRTTWDPSTYLGLNAQLSASEGEREYSASPQGLLTNGRENANLGSRLYYAPTGTLQVDISYSEGWNDRKTSEESEFRGRESRINKEVRIGLKQRVAPRTSIELDMRQRLDQSIFRERQNKNDRDQLVERASAILRSSVLPRTNARVTATFDRKNIVNINSERVGNNREDRLFELQGDLTIRPFGTVRLTQSFMMQIVYKDFHNSDDRDQFNKQGRLLTLLGMDLPGGAKIDLDLGVDFRNNGTRDANATTEVYFNEVERTDQKIRLRLDFPLPYQLRFALDTGRGSLRDENLRRRTLRQEERGDISARLSGTRRVWSDRLELKLNVEKVNAYGPRVREESSDYWVADSSFTLRF